MKSKVLETVVPPITGLVDESYPLVIALCNEKPWPWFYSSYIQLALKNDDHMGYNVRFYKTDHRGIMWDTLNPWINYNIVNVNFLKALNMEIIDFVVRSIDNGWYVSLFLDRFYVPGVRNYQNSHMTHEAMVFGYDIQNEKIMLMEYTGAYLTQFTITFSEFRDAYANCDLRRYEEVHLLRFDSQRNYEFDLINISEQLKDYLGSKNTSERYRINSNPIYSPFVSFGMDVYNVIRDLLDCNHAKYDIRLFNSLWEHKKVMTERVKYIAENGFVENFMEFYEPCKEIEDKSYLLKSQFMRLCATKNPAVLKTIYSLMDYIVDKEKTVLGRMVEKIDEQIEKNKIREVGALYPESAFRSGTHSLEKVCSDRIAIEFDLIPDNNIIDGAIGYSDSKSKVIAYSSMSFILKFNLNGYFEAMDGDVFRASTKVPYIKNKKYHISIKADFTNKTYGISAHDGDSLQNIAEYFSFGKYVQDPTDIDKITLVIDNMSNYKVMNHQIGVC